jgi:F-type H+-transporting ATPase subunit delta
MNDSKISIRYSRALFETAREKNIVEKINSDMVFMLELSKTPEMKEFLENPVIAPSKKTSIFHKMLEGNVNETTLSLIDLLVKNGREVFLPGIARAFIHETYINKGITEAVLTTAIPVDPSVKKQVSDLVEKAFATKV